jgi:hypothetical protein
VEAGHHHDDFPNNPINQLIGEASKHDPSGITPNGPEGKWVRSRRILDPRQSGEEFLP